MAKLIPAKVRAYWSGDYAVIEPGRFKGEEILKPFCIYVKQELEEISAQVAAEVGKDQGPIIEVVNRTGEVQKYAG